MTKLLQKIALLFLLGGLSVKVGAQVTIVRYSFEGTAFADVGSGLSAVTWNSGGDEGYASVFSSQGQALSVGDFESGEYYQFTLDATGYRDVVLDAFRANGTGPAPLDWKISYSLNGPGGTFTDVASFNLAANTAVGTTTINGFALPLGADDNASVVLRLIATSSTRIDDAGSVANGTVRLDNIAFTATAIPEPASGPALAGGMALLILLWLRGGAVRL